MQVVDTGHIVIEPDVLGGKPHIAGHRIAVHDVAAWTTFQGMSPEEIARNWHLTLGEVYAALSYYYDHREQVDAENAASERRAEGLAAQQHLFDSHTDQAR